MEQEHQQPLLFDSARAGPNRTKMSPTNNAVPPAARVHVATLQDLIQRAARSRIIVLYILAVTVWFLGVFQFFEVPMAAECALVLNSFLTMAYVAAMYHTGVLS
ncbi:hypothetical protein BJ166DRAFT_539209 [Pestalotiopsis sp. NC0098]|nr:hypothetical protein BJ166DRAFT_539209 [Pestalotiopsis sp. NC0098]